MLNRRRFLKLSLVTLSGCAGVPALPWARTSIVPNPLPVGIANEEVLWERGIEVLHDFQFQIAREDRFARVIETEYKTGSGILEPWHRESVGAANRLESTLQSVRRRVVVTFIPSEQQAGYMVTVEAYKELEDLPGLAGNSPGAATFQESRPLERDLNPVVGQSTPSGWLAAGRDQALEQALLTSLITIYSA